MNRDFEEKVVVVTGGGYGIGRAACLAFSRDGAKVVIADVDVTSGEETVNLIKENGGEAFVVKTDVSQETEVEALVRKTVETYGRLDCAFNNVGIHKTFVSTIDFTQKDWDQMMDINLKGMWLCMKYEIPQMLRHGKGAIVNASSVAGLIAAPSNPAYPTSKHGVIGLTKMAAVEFARKGIRVNCICPGPTTSTRMNEELTAVAGDLIAMMEDKVPMGRTAEPREIAEAAVWLCSDKASYITGVALPVDGGLVAD
jgi:NAD(P)-dependent dehydrogenase (short-subunit alcohol dehydrogenase family)